MKSLLAALLLAVTPAADIDVDAPEAPPAKNFKVETPDQAKEFESAKQEFLFQVRVDLQEKMDNLAVDATIKFKAVCKVKKDAEACSIGVVKVKQIFIASATNPGRVAITTFSTDGAGDFAWLFTLTPQGWKLFHEDFNAK